MSNSDEEAKPLMIFAKEGSISFESSVSVSSLIKQPKSLSAISIANLQKQRQIAQESQSATYEMVKVCEERLHTVTEEMRELELGYTSLLEEKEALKMNEQSLQNELKSAQEELSKAGEIQLKLEKECDRFWKRNQSLTKEAIEKSTRCDKLEKKLAVAVDHADECERKRSGADEKYHTLKEKFVAYEKAVTRKQREMLIQIAMETRTIEDHLEMKHEEIIKIFKKTNAFNKSSKKRDLKTCLNETICGLKIFASEIKDTFRTASSNGDYEVSSAFTGNENEDNI